jgi:hypothetical protein
MPAAVHKPRQGASLTPGTLPAAAAHSRLFFRALLGTFLAIEKSTSPASGLKPAWRDRVSKQERCFAIGPCYVLATPAIGRKIKGDFASRFALAGDLLFSSA